jgi:phosphomevalonate kinase
VTNNYIVSISGKRGSGKTTLAEMLVKHGFTRVSFAATLKTAVMREYGLTPEQVYGMAKETFEPKIGMTPRQKLTEYGQAKRAEDPNFWVKAFLTDLQAVTGPVVVDDMRFKNEAHMLRQQSGLMVRLARLEEDNVYKGVIDDASETDLDDYPSFDIVVPGTDNRTLGDLESLTERILDAYYQTLAVNALGSSRNDLPSVSRTWDDNSFTGFNG